MTGPFLLFSCSNDFITRLMRVYVDLIMLAAYFCRSCQSQVEYNCSFAKSDWLATWHLYSRKDTNKEKSRDGILEHQCDQDASLLLPFYLQSFYWWIF
jgi:hypothetical protein